MGDDSIDTFMSHIDMGYLLTLDLALSLACPTGTPTPLSYTRHISRSIMMWLIALSFVLTEGRGVH
jgi:hypothetical protein